MAYACIQLRSFVRMISTQSNSSYKPSNRHRILVSTTHTIIGCIIGFTAASKGFDSVNWKETKNIFISWVAAPLVTGAFAFCIFAFIRYFVLTAADPFTRGYYTFSFILFVTIGIDMFFIFNKGTKNFTHFQKEVYDNKWVVPTSFGVSKHSRVFLVGNSCHLHISISSLVYPRRSEPFLDFYGFGRWVPLSRKEWKQRESQGRPNERRWRKRPKLHTIPPNLQCTLPAMKQ